MLKTPLEKRTCRCLSLPLAVLFAGLLLASPAEADDTLFGNEIMNDQFFAESLARYGLLRNFPLQKYQALRACEEIRSGIKPLDSIHILMDFGSYSFDEANAIVSSGQTAYCIHADD